MPLLQADERVERVVGIARRPFDPSERGWTKMEYRQGDVRDVDALRTAFEEADVVVHLAFLILSGGKEKTRAINVEGTVNAFRAAAAAGAQRFVYASSVAAYGFHRDNPIGMTEDWPTRPAARLFYAQEKAEIERLLELEAAEHPELGLYVLRPPILLGPNAMGAKEVLPGPLEAIARGLAGVVGRLPVPIPAIAPALPVQFIHEADVGQAFLLCIVAAGAPGPYNITGDGVVTGAEVAREVGLAAVPVPGAPVRALAKAVAAVPTPSFAPPATEWVEALSHPAIMDAGKAKRVLGWTPRYTSLEALRDTIRREG